MESAYYQNYTLILILLLGGVFLGLFSLFLGWLCAPKKPSKIKQSVYECGVEAKGSAWVQFRVQFYIFALVFVVFDIETIFLYPWAVQFKELGVGAFVKIAIFVGMLLLSWFYVWKKGDLEWD